MLMLIVFVALMAALAVAALADKVPDTHRQVCQHGDFSF